MKLIDKIEQLTIDELKRVAVTMINDYENPDLTLPNFEKLANDYSIPKKMLYGFERDFTKKYTDRATRAAIIIAHGRQHGIAIENGDFVEDCVGCFLTETEANQFADEIGAGKWVINEAETELEQVG